MKRTLIALSLLLSAGCAREAAPVNTAKAPLTDPNEERCMVVAEQAYAAAAGHAMSSLGDAPVPDAAYEDAYAACTEGR